MCIAVIVMHCAYYYSGSCLSVAMVANLFIKLLTTRRFSELIRLINWNYPKLIHKILFYVIK